MRAAQAWRASRRAAGSSPRRPRCRTSSPLSDRRAARSCAVSNTSAPAGERFAHLVAVGRDAPSGGSALRVSSRVPSGSASSGGRPRRAPRRARCNPRAARSRPAAHGAAPTRACARSRDRPRWRLRPGGTRGCRRHRPSAPPAPPRGRRRSARSSRGEQAQPVEHQPAKAGVVLREVVDVGRGLGVRRAGERRGAIEIRRTFDLERELDLREPGSKSAGGCRCRSSRRRLQRVAREVAERRGADHQRARQVVDPVDQPGVGLPAAAHRLAPPTRPATVAKRSPPSIRTLSGVEREAGSQQPHEQCPLAQPTGGFEVVAHLEELDAVGGAAAAATSSRRRSQQWYLMCRLPAPRTWPGVCCPLEKHDVPHGDRQPAVDVLYRDRVHRDQMRPGAVVTRFGSGSARWRPAPYCSARRRAPASRAEIGAASPVHRLT